jgi:hypothetical protein
MSYSNERLSALHNRREDILERAREFNQANVESNYQTLKANTTKWDDYKQAKALIIKGYLKLNKKRNRSVYCIIYITYHLTLKGIYNKMITRKREKIMENKERVAGLKIAYKY